MRRRDFYRRHDEEASKLRKEGILESPGKERLPNGEDASTAGEVPKGILKGVCKKCGRHIGTGIYFHERKCLGDLPGP
jgi:hypothetical protein